MAREALRLEPENARAWAITGLAYDWLGLPDEAVEACDKAIELDPTLPEAYAYLAEAYIDLGNWAAANNTIDTALQLDENNADVQRNYGYILEVQGNYTSAIAAYRKALELQPGMPYLYLAIGRNQQALADIAGARESYEAAAENDPKSAAALDMLGWTYLLEGDYDSANDRSARR
jgi:tetratricopeptide (TPR) repeat protein